MDFPLERLMLPSKVKSKQVLRDSIPLERLILIQTNNGGQGKVIYQPILLRRRHQ